MSDGSDRDGAWFLAPRERGNASSAIDRGRPLAWTEGNDVRVHVDGASYFQTLFELLPTLAAGDSLYFTDWEGQRDERLAGAASEIGGVISRLVQRGVDVRALLWRSHPRQAHFSEQDNAALARQVNTRGGELILDERVKKGGSHHQKFLIVQSAGRPDDAVGFAGGIDLCHGRHDDGTHAGDPQAVELDPRYGPRPPWHDMQLELHGPAVADLIQSFRERWEDRTPLDHRNPWRMALRRFTGQPRRADPLPAVARPPERCGPHSVQVLRTYPAKRPHYPFAPEGERSIARAYLKAIARARSLVYIEDQYFWSADAANALSRGLRQNPDLRVIVVVPRFPDRDGAMTGRAGRVARADAMHKMRAAGGARVAFYDLENWEGTPIYVHAKVCVIDDVWMTVGSDNVNRRSWTHDSELSCAILDATRDQREPVDPGGLGDGARALARDTRLRLWREHLGREPGEDDDLVAPRSGFDAFQTGAHALDAWHESGCHADRPRGHVREHAPDSLRLVTRWWARVVQSRVLDPDGRPATLRRAKDY